MHVQGLAEAVRGGWGGHRAGYLVYSQKTGEPEPTQVKCGFTGVENNLLSFIRLVRGMDACATTAAAAAGVAAMSLGGEGNPSRPASPSSELSTASSITVRDAPRGATGQVRRCCARCVHRAAAPRRCTRVRCMLALTQPALRPHGTQVKELPTLEDSYRVHREGGLREVLGRAEAVATTLCLCALAAVGRRWPTSQ